MQQKLIRGMEQPGHRLRSMQTFMLLLLVPCVQLLLALPAGIECSSPSSPSSSGSSNIGMMTVGAAAVETSGEELLQLPHALRHQEHYEQRIQKAVDDFKKERDKNFIVKATAIMAAAAPAPAPAPAATATATAMGMGMEMAAMATTNDDNKNLRLQQLKAAQNEDEQREPQQQQHHQQHHLRHEQHLQHQRANRVAAMAAMPQQHHLRHHNRHHLAWEQRVLPAMRHQQHRFGYAATNGPPASAPPPTPPASPLSPQQQQPATTASKVGYTTEGPFALNNNNDNSNNNNYNHSNNRMQRYFDRDSVYSWTQTTHGPSSGSSSSSGHKVALPATTRTKATASSNRYNLAFGDDNRPFGDNDFDEYSAERPAAEHAMTGKRYSLAWQSADEARRMLDAADDAADSDDGDDDDDNDEDDVAAAADDYADAENREKAKKAKFIKDKYGNGYKHAQVGGHGNGNVNIDAATAAAAADNDNDDDHDDDDDYSYEDAEAAANQNEFPSVSSPMGKVSVKRNLFTNLFKSFQTKTIGKDQQEQAPTTPAPPQRKLEPTAVSSDRSGNERKLNANDSGNVHVSQHNDNNNSNNNNNHHHNDHNDDNDDDDDNVDNDDEDDEGFSNEKWNKIEHEHYLRQQQHQKELQALRKNNRHKSHATKQQIEDTDNVYSRYYTQGTITEQKHEELGTAAAVSRSHQVHVSRSAKDRALAERHIKQMLMQTTCRIPQARVERIQLDPSKIYTPQCTILHRCADDTGCCGPSRTCAPKHTAKVHLFFFVHSKGKSSTIERLTFVNHTECHCIERMKHAEHMRNHAGASNLQMYNNNAEPEHYYSRRALQSATILNCNCPNLYEKILQDDGVCRCDCSSSNTACDWFKRGMEHFSMKDRKCILEGRCKPPTCEYGNYNKKFGRCPRQTEQRTAENNIS